MFQVNLSIWVIFILKCIYSINPFPFRSSSAYCYTRQQLMSKSWEYAFHGKAAALWLCHYFCLISAHGLIVSIWHVMDQWKIDKIGPSSGRAQQLWSHHHIQASSSLHCKKEMDMPKLNWHYLSRHQGVALWLTLSLLSLIKITAFIYGNSYNDLRQLIFKYVLYELIKGRRIK